MFARRSLVASSKIARRFFTTPAAQAAPEVDAAAAAQAAEAARVAEVSSLFSQFRTTAQAGDVDAAFKALAGLRTNNASVPSSDFEVLMSKIAAGKNTTQAFKLFYELELQKVKPTQATFDAFQSVFSGNAEAKKAIEVYFKKQQTA